MEAALEPPEHGGGSDKSDGEEEEPAPSSGKDRRTRQWTHMVQNMWCHPDGGTPESSQSLAHPGTRPAAGVHRFGCCGGHAAAAPRLASNSARRSPAGTNISA
jgi:hypothetical protein